MKRSVKSLILVLVLAVFIGGYLGIQRLTQAPASVEEESGSFALTERSADELTGLTWPSGEEACHFVKADGAWTNADKETFPVDQTAVQELADSLAALTASRKLDGVKNLADYGLTEPAFTVTAEWSDGASTVYAMGSETPFGDGYYLTLGEDGVAYTIEDSLETLFAKTANDLAAWETLPTVETVTRLTVGGALDAVYEETSHTVNPDQHWYDADGHALDGVDDLISDAKAVAWKALVSADASADDLTAWLLDDASATAVTLYNGGDAVWTLLFGDVNEDGDVYARLPGSSMVYTVASDSAADLRTATAESLRSMTLLSLGWEELGSATLTFGENSLTLTPPEQAEEAEGTETEGTEDADAETADEEPSPEETLWTQLTALTAKERTEAEGAGDVLLTVEVAAASGASATLTFTEYDADSYLLTLGEDRFLVGADAVDRLIRAAKQLL